MSILGALQIGSSALGAASVAIETTSHNVANAGTEGYTRRTAESSALDPVLRDGLWVGSGVTVQSIQRVADDLLGVRLVDQAGAEAMASSANGALQVVETWFNEADSAGPAQRLAEFFDALAAATSDPSDQGLRLAAAQAGDALAEAVVRTATGVQEAMADDLGQVDESLTELNAKLEELASVNQAIGSSGDGTPAGDLLDRRDQLVRELAEGVGASVHIEADGEATLLIGGHAAVSGGEARSLSLGEDSSGDPALLLSTGDGAVDVTGDAGGKVGGLFEAYDASSGYLDQLDDFAATLADAFNAQHAAGYDASGAAGGDLFSATAGEEATTLSFSSDVLSDPSLWAFAGSSAAEAGDGDNLSSLLDLEDQELFDGSTKTGAQVLASLYSQVGSDVASSGAEADSAGAALADIQGLRDAVSGVNLDEEAVALIQAQAAYQAAAKVVQAADQMLGVLMDL